MKIEMKQKLNFHPSLLQFFVNIFFDYFFFEPLFLVIIYHTVIYKHDTNL